MFNRYFKTLILIIRSYDPVFGLDTSLIIQLLVLQQKMKVPVPLTPVDFLRMLNLFVGNSIDEFSTLRKLPPTNSNFPSKATSRLAECEDLPPGAVVYAAFNKEIQATIRYSALLDNAVQGVAIQVLRMASKWWFRMRVWNPVTCPVQLEIMRDYHFNTAIDLFEYW